MTNPILIKRSAVALKAPIPSDLALGELAINTVDGKLYLKKNVTGTETIVEVGYAVSTAQSAADTAIGTAAASDATAKVLVETNARVAADTAAIATAATAADAKVLVETNARVAADTAAIATAATAADAKVLVETNARVSNDATTLASAKTYADGLITTITGAAGAAFDTLVEIQNAMATDAELTAAIAAITNVATATKLQTARTIQGVSFDGSAAITVATAGTGITVSGTTISTTITQYTDTGARAALSATAPVAYNSTTGVISIPAATTSVAGHLTAADWNTFNDKQAALGFTPYNSTNPSGYTTNTGTVQSVSGTGTVSGLTLSGAVTGSGQLTLGGAITGFVTALTDTLATVTARGASTAVASTFSGGLTTTVLTTGLNTTAGTITGNWGLSAGSKLSATYADLAENYVADAEYAPGTVVEFGGDFEVTSSTEAGTTRVAGVVTTAPAYVMNSECAGEFIVTLALQGRVPVKVTGSVRKGDLLVSAGNGSAHVDNSARSGTIIGKSLENFTGETGVIEVAVGRF